MLGPVIVALVTVGLLFTGFAVVNQSQGDAETVESREYSDDFFGSLDSLVGGLEDSAKRGNEIKQEKYQKYLEAQGEIESLRTQPRVQSNIRTQATTPQVQSTQPKPPEVATPQSSEPKATPEDITDLDLDFDFDFDFGDIEF